VTMEVTVKLKSLKS